MKTKIQHGFTLIELLVAMMISIVGILGLMTIQAKAFEYTNEAVNRNKAIELANDYIEIVRIFPGKLYTGGVVNGNIIPGSPFLKAQGQDINCSDTKAAHCSSILRWRQKVLNTLIGAGRTGIFKERVSINAATTGDRSVIEITLSWVEKDSLCWANSKAKEDAVNLPTGHPLIPLDDKGVPNKDGSCIRKYSLQTRV